ncbi:MAG: hypothetical protein KJ065_27670 [Anaerolineae bacterium]|nr:hypothetical protein [Anaerolineae bacterium]
MPSRLVILFVSSLISALVIIALILVISVLGGAQFFTETSQAVKNIVFYGSFIVLNAFLYPRLARLASRPGKLVTVLKAQGDWMSPNDIAASLKRPHLAQEHYDLLEALEQQGRIEIRTVKQPGEFTSRQFYRYVAARK